MTVPVDPSRPTEPVEEPALDLEQTVWREGDLIRRTDGMGYSDRVSDEMIRRHIETHELDPLDDLFVSFAEAVLAIRRFERQASR